MAVLVFLVPASTPRTMAYVALVILRFDHAESMGTDRGAVSPRRCADRVSLCGWGGRVCRLRPSGCAEHDEVSASGGNWIKDLKPGDRVAIRAGAWSDSVYIAKVERLTATQVVIVGLTSRYRINGGWECGARGIEASRIDRVTPELEAMLIRLTTKRRVVRLEGMEAPMRKKCIGSGAVIGSREASRSVRCPCGYSAPAVPRQNRRVAGEVIPGWTVRVPSHTEGK